jgi:hypothetical protein
VRHYEERPEIEQDYEQMKSGGWQLKKLSSTRYTLLSGETGCVYAAKGMS